jgi:hypothetical protein
MLQVVHPKLPMRSKQLTRQYYVTQLGFEETADYGDYLIVEKDQVEIHFFSFEALDPASNYGQVYIRTDQIDQLYQGLLAKGVAIHPNAPLAVKPWGQKEFSLLDPNNNLLTFGQAVEE